MCPKSQSEVTHEEGNWDKKETGLNKENREPQSSPVDEVQWRPTVVHTLYRPH